MNVPGSEFQLPLAASVTASCEADSMDVWISIITIGSVESLEGRVVVQREDRNSACDNGHI